MTCLRSAENSISERMRRCFFEEKAVIGDKEYFVGYTKEYVKVAKETDENLENQIVSGRISGMLTDEILLFE